MSLFSGTKTILIVGSGVRMRDQLCLALSREGCLIRVSGNERAALTLLNDSAPDVVLFDPELSEIGVPQFHQRLRDKNPLVRLVLIVQTHEETKKDWDGVRHFLKMPFTQNALLSSVGMRRSDPR